MRWNSFKRCNTLANNIMPNIVERSYAALLPHTIEIELFDRHCRVLNIDALITSKRAIARPKDKEVILQLRAIQE